MIQSGESLRGRSHARQMSGPPLSRCRRRASRYGSAFQISWIDWELTPAQEELLRFTRRVVAVFNEQPVFRRRRFFHGRKIHGVEAPEIAWFDPSGDEMTEEHWNTSFVRCLGVRLLGGRIDVDEQGEEITGDSMLLLFNADHGQTIPFTLPRPKIGGEWKLVFDTARPELDEAATLEKAYSLEPCSLAVFAAPVERKEPGI